tara:strand:- start:64 stop:294 length:231 start_codon:yes stop_codon:yes gene_type:complete
MNKDKKNKKEIDPKVQEERIQAAKRALEEHEKEEKIENAVGEYILLTIIAFILLLIILSFLYPKIPLMIFWKILGN